MSSPGTGLPVHENGGPSPQELARRQAADREAREREGQTWLDVIGEALVASGCAPDLPGKQADLDAAVIDAMRHAFGGWEPPGDGRPLIARAVEQASTRLLPELERMVREQVAEAVEALAEEEES